MRRWVSWSLILSVFAFAGLGALSLWLYPGGNAFNRHTQGYHFWHNFICDALAPRAIDGTPNILGSRVGIAAMGVIALLGLAVLWGWVPRLLRARRWIVWLVRVSGMMAILGLLLMFGEAFMKMPLSHHVLVLSAATPGIIATSVVLAVSFRHRLWPLGFIAWVWP